MTMPHRAFGLFAAILATPLLIAADAAAQSYPSQTVKIIVPNPAGGTTFRFTLRAVTQEEVRDAV